MPATPDQSHLNYDILVGIQETLRGQNKRFDEYTQKQDAVNEHLHTRINETQDKFSLVIDGLKDGRRITWPIVSALLGLLSVLGLSGAAYVTMRIDPMNQNIANNTSKVNAADAHRLSLQRDIESLATTTAHQLGRSESDREWMAKLLDEQRNKK